MRTPSFPRSLVLSPHLPFLHHHHHFRSMMSLQQGDIELLELVADSRLTGYLAVAALCVLLYDHILCFSQEVELMWKSRWGIAKIIYLWNRYFSLVVVSLNMSGTSPLHRRSTLMWFNILAVLVREIGSSHRCIGWLHVQAASSTILIATVDFVLMLRVWILYGGPRWMMWCFVSLGTAEVVAMTIVDLFSFAQMKEYVHLGYSIPLLSSLLSPSTSSHSSVIKGCYAYNVPRVLTIYAAIPLLVTFIMFAMTFYKCIVTLYRMEHGTMPFWTLFLRDGIVWFVLVFTAGGSELVILTARRETLKQLLILPALAVYSGVASHSLLNIKQMAKEASQSQLDDVDFPRVYGRIQVSYR
ncbi:hypothetical protein B0H16DRAFT_1879909 [Mycena metata]|uniref:DUF6533 domain-containing protein n=1 Tax=Mycena metata TaxID=1033252 RepID=A0AAD7K058_9AGAR|nr:hypothetical protein B0H16DRAFT_1879909 [Mycena metata]